MSEKLKLFIILRGETEKKRIPIHAFVESNYEKAKLYFQGYLWGEKPTLYVLKQIGTFENGKLITNNIFITGGLEVNKKTQFEHKKINQMKLKFEQNKFKNGLEQQLDYLFGGIQQK